MLGLFATLNMGARALGVQQQASEITGNNLANVNNPAYSRESLVQQSSTPMDTPVGEEGTGVDAVGIQQFRDAFLDSQITSQSSVTNGLSTEQSALQNAEAYLNEQVQNSASANTSAGSLNGIAAALDNLSNSLQDLSANPDSTTTSYRQTVVSDATHLAGMLNQLSSQLSTVRNGVNQSIQNDVASGNQDLSDIANLNLEIANATLSGGSADALVDQRQQKIEDLASKVNISTTTESNGSVDVSIGGVTMVSGFTKPDTMQTYDAGGGQILVRAPNAGTTLTLTGGSIGGGIAARDGALGSLQTGLDTLASSLVTNFNSIYAGATGQNFFSGSNAATIAVSASLVADPSTLQAGVGASGDNSIALALAQLQNQPIASLSNQTFSQSYASTVSALGNSIAATTDQLNNSQSVSQMLNNQRSSVSGVNMDEEMTNLLEYQKAYQASAELITTINNMLETVINMKTI